MRPCGLGAREASTTSAQREASTTSAPRSRRAAAPPPRGVGARPSRSHADGAASAAKGERRERRDLRALALRGARGAVRVGAAARRRGAVRRERRRACAFGARNTVAATVTGTVGHQKLRCSGAWWLLETSSYTPIQIFEFEFGCGVALGGCLKLRNRTHPDTEQLLGSVAVRIPSSATGPLAAGHRRPRCKPRRCSRVVAKQSAVQRPRGSPGKPAAGAASAPDTTADTAAPATSAPVTAASPREVSSSSVR
jgi:hypothetical protein